MYTRRLVSELVRRGVAVTVVCAVPEGTTSRPSAPGISCTIHTVPVPSWCVSADHGRAPAARLTPLRRYRVGCRSPWRAFGAGASSLAEQVSACRPDVILVVDWSAMAAMDALASDAGDSLRRVPRIFFSVRVVLDAIGACARTPPSAARACTDGRGADVSRGEVDECEEMERRAVQTSQLVRTGRGAHTRAAAAHARPRACQTVALSVHDQKILQRRSTSADVVRAAGVQTRRPPRTR